MFKDESTSDIKSPAPSITDNTRFSESKSPEELNERFSQEFDEVLDHICETIKKMDDEGNVKRR